MLNEVVLTGRLEEIYQMNENTIFAKIRVNDEDSFYLYWEDDKFFNEKLLKSYVCVKGNLRYIKVKKFNNQNIMKVLAICVKGMEKYDF